MTFRVHEREVQREADGSERWVVIAVSNVSYEYRSAQGRVLALMETSLSVSQGELAVLLGTSGCGKTTLLNLIAGFLKPTVGQVLVEGMPVTKPTPRCTVVFQDHALFDWMTVAKNIDAGLHASGLSRTIRKQRVNELLELVGLTEFAELYPRQLSGGMRQRAGLARALAPSPAVIVLDEPFASLDALSREKLQDELKAIWRAAGTTGVLVTHSIEEAAYLGDVVHVMTPAPGRICATVKPRLESGIGRGDDAFTRVTRELRRAVEAAETIVGSHRQQVNLKSYR